MRTPLSRVLARVSGGLIGAGILSIAAIRAAGGQVTYSGELRFVPIYCWWLALTIAIAGVAARWRRNDASGGGLWLCLVASLLLSVWGYFMYSFAHSRF